MLSMDYGFTVNTDKSQILQRCKKRTVAVFTGAEAGEWQMIFRYFMNFKTFATFQLYTDTGKRNKTKIFRSKEFCFKDLKQIIYTNSAFVLDNVV
jgi:hypothetical protein